MERLLINTSYLKEMFSTPDIRRGAIISIKHPNIGYPILNVIKRIENECLYFRAPEEFSKKNISKGEELQVNVLTEKYEYVIKGKILDIEQSYPKFVQCYPLTFKRFKNLRKNKRYWVNLNAYITLSGYKEKSYAVVRNLSIGGLSIAFKEIVTKNELISIDLYLDTEAEEIVSFIAKVVRCSQYNGKFTEYGLQIVQIDGFSKDTLQKYIDFLDDNETRFISNCLK